RRRVRRGDHVRLVDAGETLDRRSVKANTVRERALQLSRSDRDGLQVAEHVGKPEPDKTDVPLLERAQHELLLPVHASHLKRPQPIPSLPVGCCQCAVSLFPQRYAVFVAVDTLGTRGRRGRTELMGLPKSAGAAASCFYQQAPGSGWAAGG